MSGDEFKAQDKAYFDQGLLLAVLEIEGGEIHGGLAARQRRPVVALASMFRRIQDRGYGVLQNGAPAGNVGIT